MKYFNSVDDRSVVKLRSVILKCVVNSDWSIVYSI